MLAAASRQMLSLNSLPLIRRPQQACTLTNILLAWLYTDLAGNLLSDNGFQIYTELMSKDICPLLPLKNIESVSKVLQKGGARCLQSLRQSMMHTQGDALQD